jgi:hypothetical protein
MKKQFLPYYLSRSAFSCIFALYVFGATWGSMLFAFVLFGLFLLYFHSGWFSIDYTNPYFPLRRDHRGILIQRKALLVAVVAGILTHLVCASGFCSVNLATGSGSIALSLGILAYFITQILLFVKA